MPDPKAILGDILARPNNAAFYELALALGAAFPGWSVLETQDWAFQLAGFVDAGLCHAEVAEGFPVRWSYRWYDRDETIHADLEDGWQAVEWEGRSLYVLHTGLYVDFSCREERSFVLAPTEALAREFFTAVCRWGSEVHGEVLVFSDGGWSKSEELFASIQSTTLDGLVLPDALKREVRENVRGFFGAQATYDRYGLPWKRGLLLLGPPGNGKTHMIKGLANDLDVPCLYVRNFTSRYGTPHGNIDACFARARNLAPCLLVLEDLDALVDDENRSAFLNEMDGFYSNRGILTLATTNHPERLDPAILDRPSRFDRKFTFALPDEPMRRRYLAHQNAGLDEALRLSEAGLELAASRTEGFSYAYLKELLLSSMMAWIREDGARAMDEVLPELVDALAGQMRTEAERPAPTRKPRVEDGFPGFSDADE